jgi:hypothetical protein
MYTVHLYNGTVTRDADGIMVAPAQSVDDPNFSAYQSWVNSGGSPTVDDTRQPDVPQEVTPCQFRLALNAANLRTQVEAAVKAADQDTQDMWEYGNPIIRSNPQLNAMAASLGLTSAQVDQLFITAAAFP